MARYWSFGLKWLVTPILTILSVSFLVFTALSFTPGDPVAQILGGKATPEQRELMRAQLGLDDPLIVRYFTWLGGFITGDLGTSYAYRDSVRSSQRSEEHTSELQSRGHLVCRLLLEKKKQMTIQVVSY